MSAQRRAGTAWESRVVGYLREHGWPYAERRALSGSGDRGDVAGVPGVVIEAKCARRVELAAWLDETTRETANDGAAVGLLWLKRRGHASPASGFVVMSGATAVQLLGEAGYR